MSETNNVERKPNISRLALVAFLTPILYIIASCFAIYYNKLNLDLPVPIEVLIGVFFTLFGMIVMSYLFVLPVSFILGFIAIIKITLSKRLLKGYTFSILGILMSVWAFDLSAGAFICPRMYALERLCQSRMEQLGNTIHEYSQAHNGQYPEPNKWCDLLSEFWKSQKHEKISNADFDLLVEKSFLCPNRYSVKWTTKRSSYAMNPHCKPDSPPDTVLLFETEKGWNTFGGPECVSFNHPIISVIPFRRIRACNVLFNDGHVELINPKKIGNLKWKDEKAR